MAVGMQSAIHLIFGITTSPEMERPGLFCSDKTNDQ
jgi:hypothetical protein